MKSDDVYVCTICTKKETDGSNFLTCMYCFTSSHFKCKNIVGNAVRRMRESDYFCSPDCSAIYQRIILMQNNNQSLMSSFAAEMKAVISAAVTNEMRSLKTEVKQITASIEKSQEFLAAKFDEIVADFKDLKVENEKLKNEIDQLKNSQNQLKSEVHKLEAIVDKSDKAALDNNIVLWGIPASPDENLLNVVDKLFHCLGLEVNSNVVTSAERIFDNNKNNNTLVPIRIVFCDKKSKEKVLDRKKQFGKLLSTAIDEKFVVNGRALNVTLRDELSPLSLELLKELRESQELLNIKYVWTGRGGVVLVKKADDSKPELVKTRDDLSRIMCRFSQDSNFTGQFPSPKRNKFVL